MNYTAITVLLGTAPSHHRLLEVVSQLATTFSASVTGVIANQLEPPYGDGLGVIDPFACRRETRHREAVEAEAEFHHVLEEQIPRRRCCIELDVPSVAEALVRHAAGADLLVVQAGDFAGFGTAGLVLSELVMLAGRPVLVLPAELPPVSLERVLVGWKDTRETRRAIADALPLLRQAGHVTLAEVVSDQGVPAARSRLIDVAAWLRPHGVHAHYRIVSANEHPLLAFKDLIKEIDATLIVGGAYGHHRVREWVLGGFTRDLLLSGEHCTLVSH